VRLRFEPPYTQSFGDVSVSLPPDATALELVRVVREMCQLGHQSFVLVAYAKDKKVLLELEDKLALFIAAPGVPLFVSLFVALVFFNVTPSEPPTSHNLSVPTLVSQAQPRPQSIQSMTYATTSPHYMPPPLPLQPPLPPPQHQHQHHPQQPHAQPPQQQHRQHQPQPQLHPMRPMPAPRALAPGAVVVPPIFSQI